MADTSTNSWKLLYEAGRQALQSRKLQEAEQSFSAALQLAEDFAPGDPRLAATLNALARIYSLQRRYLAAAALLNRLLEVTERTLGPSHVQVAGVLTNLAEMYTHLGAAREELELRERVLAIRGDDPDADAGSLQRLRERVTELRSMLDAQEPADEEEEIEPLPMVRTSEYSAAIATIEEPAISEPVAGNTATIEREPVAVMERDDAYRLSPATSQLSVAPWPGAAATGSTPTGGRTVEMEVSAEHSAYADVARTPASAPVHISSDHTFTAPEPSTYSFHSAADHGFSDMGRDELVSPIAQRFAGRTRLFSIAAGVVLVAGILAARSYVATPDGDRVAATGSVSLANAATPAAVVPPVSQPTETPDPRSVERMMADRRAERETKRANDEGERTTVSSETREREPVVLPRVPAAADLERTLRGVDGALKAIDQRAKAVTDSASAIRVQAPTFKKSRIADP